MGAAKKEDSSIKHALFEYLLRRADDHFILSHRLSQWVGHAPMLEEELALANIALDLLGQARILYSYAGELEGAGRDEDQLAYLRQEHEYHNLLLVEKDNGDFAQTIVRQLFFSVHANLEWLALGASNDERLRAIAAKAQKESSYHVRHCAQWFIRLGDGSEESTARTVAGIQIMAPLVAELFDEDAICRCLVEAGIVANQSAIQTQWEAEICTYFNEAMLDTALLDATPVKGARSGRHSEAMGHILSDIQYMQRTYAGCQW